MKQRCTTHDAKMDNSRSWVGQLMCDKMGNLCVARWATHRDGQLDIANWTADSSSLVPKQQIWALYNIRCGTIENWKLSIKRRGTQRLYLVQTHCIYGNIAMRRGTYRRLQFHDHLLLRRCTQRLYMRGYKLATISVCFVETLRATSPRRPANLISTSFSKQNKLSSNGYHARQNLIISLSNLFVIN